MVAVKMSVPRQDTRMRDAEDRQGGFVAQHRRGDGMG
jgi:hypothetical protein